MYAYAINYSLKLDAISFNLFSLNYLSICITYVERGDGPASLNVSPERDAVINFKHFPKDIFSINGRSFVLCWQTVINKLIHCLIIYVSRQETGRKRDAQKFLFCNKV